ncbi:MAG: hypothetical protein JXA54_05460 [Candidatus Heimdallarchaeota archaeon]|nr:hypothetical protein [Candidatus Heimdallarchaeota archaeon]
MEEFKEIPMDDSEEESSETNNTHDEIGELPEVYKKRAQEISNSIFRFLGILLLILAIIILPFIIISFFYHFGQSNETALLIEQVLGFILSGVAIIVGSTLIYNTRKAKRQEYILEPILKNSEGERVQESEKI